MKAISIDVGLKRVGVAFSPNMSIVVPLDPIPRKNRNQAAQDVEKVINEYKPDALIVGLPKGGSSEDEMERRIKHFISLLTTDIKIYYVDEYGTSIEAKELTTGVFKHKKDGKLDSIAAKVILERYISTNYKKTLYYIFDPMCSWCWAFAPIFEELKNNLPKNIKIVKLLGGLAPDTQEEMTQEMKEKIQSIWRQIHSLTNREFNFDYWKKNRPRRSTYPSCRAVISAREFHKEDEMIKSIGEAYYLKAKNPSLNKTLIECATDLNIDEDEFKEIFFSQQTEDTLKEEISKSQNFGVFGFPTLLLEDENQKTKINIDYNNYENILKDIKKLN